jgi:hypothetical protein
MLNIKNIEMVRISESESDKPWAYVVEICITTNYAEKQISVPAYFIVCANL